jgi:hypothetical protein
MLEAAMEDELQIRLSRDQAIVLSAWLDRQMTSPSFAENAIDDRAVWSPLLRISGTLEQVLVEIFREDYNQTLDSSRERLIAGLGEFGASESPS